MRGGRLRGSSHRRCTLCGAVLASDESEGTRVCSPCHRRAREYNPAHDPELGERVLAVLQAHPGKPVHVYRELGIESAAPQVWWCVKGHIRRLKRHGYVIEGSHDGTWTYLGREERRAESVPAVGGQRLS